MTTELPRTEEGQVALPPTTAEMGRKPIVRDQLVKALKGALILAEGYVKALAKTGLDVTVETELLLNAQSIFDRAGEESHDD